MIDRQARRPWRDGALFVLGLGGLLAVELLLTPASAATDGGFVYGALFGCSVAVLLSGVFRATDRQLATSAISLGIGFGIGALVDLL
ncbi:hypothetical protein [Halomarina oriensis]|uniref:Uncharacterized protein n=1 Tax=Halomarina oriensis TaxID=671145 RepID=A0A6B0GRI5_9EURY|nr:hypothetical protein [Halomarina oriensis]MWG35303.1 hypothetical protein [Halomarina oriensis]